MIQANNTQTLSDSKDTGQKLLKWMLKYHCQSQSKKTSADMKFCLKTIDNHSQRNMTFNMKILRVHKRRTKQLRTGI